MSWCWYLRGGVFLFSRMISPLPQPIKTLSVKNRQWIHGCIFTSFQSLGFFATWQYLYASSLSVSFCFSHNIPQNLLINQLGARFLTQIQGKKNIRLLHGGTNAGKLSEKKICSCLRKVGGCGGCAGAHLYRFLRADVPISSPPCVQWSHIGSLQVTMVVLFTPCKHYKS